MANVLPRARVAVALAILTLCLQAGACGQKPAEAVAVKGRVERADRRPVKGLLVTFHPQDEGNKAGRLLVAAVDADGRFAGECLPGRYKVTLATLVTSHGGAPAGKPGAPVGKGPSPVEPYSNLGQYRQAHTTPWEVTIPRDGKQDLVLTVR
jgi:hypothetical protein